MRRLTVAVDFAPIESIRFDSIGDSPNERSEMSESVPAAQRPQWQAGSLDGRACKGSSVVAVPDSGCSRDRRGGLGLHRGMHALDLFDGSDRVDLDLRVRPLH
jgi:hypothetical protein